MENGTYQIIKKREKSKNSKEKQLLTARFTKEYTYFLLFNTGIYNVTVLKKDLAIGRVQIRKKK